MKSILTFLIIITLSFKAFGQLPISEIDGILVVERGLYMDSIGFGTQLFSNGQFSLRAEMNDASPFITLVQEGTAGSSTINHGSSGMFIRTSNNRPIMISPGYENSWSSAEGIVLRPIMNQEVYVGINKNVPEARLHIADATNILTAGSGGNRTNYTLHHGSGSPASNGSGFTLENNSTNNRFWSFYVENGSGDLTLFFDNEFRGRFDDTSGSYSATSDKKLKANINNFEFDLGKLDQLTPKSYHFKNDKNKTEYLGFIAQEVEKVIPQLVVKGSIGDTDEEIQTLNYSGFGIVAIAALKQLKEEVEQENEKLQEQIDVQQGQIDELKSFVNQLLSDK